MDNPDKQDSLSFLQQINSLLEEHRADHRYRIIDLAADLNISRAQLHRKVKNITGKSCSEHVRDKRLEEAYKLLQANDKSVTEIAYEVGFNNLSYFARSFKKKFSINPSDILKNHQK